jgi:hypothetical protein
MIGVDVEENLPTPAFPTPVGVYVVVSTLGGLISSALTTIAVTDSPFSIPLLGPDFVSSVRHNREVSMKKGTDIGSMIPHVGYPPLNPLLIPIILFSSSKSLFGASTVLIEKDPIATACFLVTNLNLNCNNKVALPTGTVIAKNTVKAGMTLSDYIEGACMMVFLMVLDAVLQGLGGKNKPFDRVASRIASKIVSPLIRKVTEESIKNLFENLGTAGIQNAPKLIPDIRPIITHS